VFIAKADFSHKNANKQAVDLFWKEIKLMKIGLLSGRSGSLPRSPNYRWINAEVKIALEKQSQ
jgi:hypothetical protein